MKKKKNILLIIVICLILIGVWFIRNFFENSVQLECNKEDPLSDDCLRQYAREIKLNGKKFDKCYQDGQFRETIENEMEYGQSIGVRGGPSFFIGEGDASSIKGFYIGGAREYEYFTKLIDNVEKKGIKVTHDEFVIEQFGSEEELLEKYKEAYSSKGLSVQEIEKKALQAVTRDLGAYELKEIETQNGIVLGRKDAKVVFMEFSEFDCKFCQKLVVETFPKIESEYIDKGKLRYIFNDFPLAIENSRSFQAANAARCANDQKRFLKYREIIYNSVSY